MPAFSITLPLERRPFTYAYTEGAPLTWCTTRQHITNLRPNLSPSTMRSAFLCFAEPAMAETSIKKLEDPATCIR
eukprot:scaffold8732_cov39-Tisochrysis_lutea.AAC.5